MPVALVTVFSIWLPRLGAGAGAGLGDETGEAGAELVTVVVVEPADPDPEPDDPDVVGDELRTGAEDPGSDETVGLVVLDDECAAPLTVVIAAVAVLVGPVELGR